MFTPMLLFQSSPVPKDGCYADTLRRQGMAMLVSILTRPEGRVLPEIFSASANYWQFQSSPVPKDGCYAFAILAVTSIGGFNPHPSRRTGATLVPFTALIHNIRFQSSPVPKDGCYTQHFQPELFRLMRFNPHPSRRTGATPVDYS